MSCLPSSSLAEAFIGSRLQLRMLAQRIVGTLDLAEEVVQEAYLKVVERASIEVVSKPQAFCSQVVRNVALDHYRRQKVESTYRIYSDDGELPPVAGGFTPDQLVQDRRMLAAVDRALDTLPARTRHAFELYRLSGMTQRDIGKTLDCSATLVNFMIKDAMQVLMSCPVLRTGMAD